MDRDKATRLWGEFCSTGNREAFEDLYRTFQPRIFRVCRANLGDEQAADEVTTELFWVMFDKCPRARNGFPTMLFSWAHNLCRRYRGRRKEEGLPKALDVAGSNMLQDVERREELDALERALDVLTDDQRHVFVLHAFEGFTFTEIASILGKTRWTVGRLYDEAFRRLRESLDDR